MPTLPFSTILAASQLRHLKARVWGTAAGVCVSILLVFMQIGFMTAVVGSVTQVANNLAADLLVTGPQYNTMLLTPSWVSRNLLMDALAVPGVAAVTPLYMAVAQVRCPSNAEPEAVRFIAFDPSSRPLLSRSLQNEQRFLNLPRAALLDNRSRACLTDVTRLVERSGSVNLYLQVPADTLAPEIDIKGAFSLGPDFSVSGLMVTSDLTFYRLFAVPLDRVSLGLVVADPDQDLPALQAQLRSRLGAGALVFTKQQLVNKEAHYVVFSTPIGVILGSGAAIGIVIGAVFLAQALHAIVGANMSEYAVLKALGYGDGFFISLVLQAAGMIAASAFFVSLLLTAVLYHVLQHATNLPFALSLPLILFVVGAVAIMSGISAAFAIRALGKGSPLDLFS